MPFISPRETPITGNLLSIIVKIFSLVLEAEYRKFTAQVKIIFTNIEEWSGQKSIWGNIF
jgi:hypothetical protein